MGSISVLFHSPIKSCNSKRELSSLPTISTYGEGTSTQLQTRRNLMLTLLGGLTLSTADCKPAQAFSLGISGPKEWLKAQKKRTANFLMAPIGASRDRLNSAYHLLREITSNKDHEEAERLVKVAARDCIPPEEGSFVAFQASTGVEVCTFNLILKNASSLLDDTDVTKLKADVAFKNLVRSFIALDGLVASGKPGVALSRKLKKTGPTQSELIRAGQKIRIQPYLVYRKATHTDIYLQTLYPHNPAQKPSVLRTLATKALGITDEVHIEQEKEHLTLYSARMATMGNK